MFITSGMVETHDPDTMDVPFLRIVNRVKLVKPSDIVHVNSLPVCPSGSFLKQEEKNTEAIKILSKFVKMTEVEAKKKSVGVVDSYPYEQLAIIYRRLGNLDEELAILERFETQPQVPGSQTAILAKRLEKVRQLKGGKQDEQIPSTPPDTQPKRRSRKVPRSGSW